MVVHVYLSVCFISETTEWIPINLVLRQKLSGEFDFEEAG
jgi:hypothetical protein